MKIFSKQKMMERLEREGRTHLIDEKSSLIMGMLDGKEAIKNDFKALVYDEIEFIVRCDGEYYPVNVQDCIEK